MRDRPHKQVAEPLVNRGGPGPPLRPQTSMRPGTPSEADLVPLTVGPFHEAGDAQRGPVKQVWGRPIRDGPTR